MKKNMALCLCTQVPFLSRNSLTIEGGVHFVRDRVCVFSLYTEKDTKQITRDERTLPFLFFPVS